MTGRHVRLEQVLAAMPYAGYLGLRGDLDGEALTLTLPFRDDLIGNTSLPAIHGGAQGAFLEIAALVRLALALPDEAKRPLTIGVTVEYLRPGRPQDTFARPTIKRLGRRTANIHVEAWQEDEGSPIALLQGRFLLS